jgi:tRNA pseudouridine38-40 synthase
MRYRAVVAYVGTFFHGWQVQENAPRTVQGSFEEGLSAVFGESVRVHASGRTDAGVHADGQVVHFDARPIPSGGLRVSLNRRLPWDLRVLGIEEAPVDFHARSDATGKRYVYRFSRDRVIEPRNTLFVAPISPRAEASRMAAAARAVAGTHDFFPFSTFGTETESTIRTVSLCAVEEAGPRLTIVIEADGFLRGMARAIAGTLSDVSRGRLPIEIVEEIFSRGSKSLVASKARPRGLTLEKVFYPFFDNILAE